MTGNCCSPLRSMNTGSVPRPLKFLGQREPPGSWPSYGPSPEFESNCSGCCEPRGNTPAATNLEHVEQRVDMYQRAYHEAGHAAFLRVKGEPIKLETMKKL